MRVISNKGGKTATRVEYTVTINDGQGFPKLKINVPVLVTQTDDQAAGLTDEKRQWSSAVVADECGQPSDDPTVPQFFLSARMAKAVCNHAAEDVVKAQKICHAALRLAPIRAAREALAAKQTAKLKAEVMGAMRHLRPHVARWIIEPFCDAILGGCTKGMMAEAVATGSVIGGLRGRTRAVRCLPEGEFAGPMQLLRYRLETKPGHERCVDVKVLGGWHANMTSERGKTRCRDRRDELDYLIGLVDAAVQEIKDAQEKLESRSFVTVDRAATPW